MPFPGMRWSLVICAVLVSALGGTAAPAPARAQDPLLERRVQLETQVRRALNDVRAARGLHALRATPGLRTAAAEHSRAMLAHGFFTHASIDGTPFHHRIRKHYPARGWEVWTVGETLLADSGTTTDARAIVSAWLRSPGHRKIVLSSSWHEVGIGAFFRPDAPGHFGGSAALVVTADFGFRSGKQSSPRIDA